MSFGRNPAAAAADTTATGGSSNNNNSPPNVTGVSNSISPTRPSLPLPSASSLQSLNSLASIASGSFSNMQNAGSTLQRNASASGSFSFPRPPNRMVTRQTSHQVVQPTAERSETDECVRLQVDMPGIFPQDVSLSLFKNMLFIKAVRRKFNADNVCVKKYIIQKRYPFDVAGWDAAKLQANMNRGVLTVSAPRKPTVYTDIGTTSNMSDVPATEKSSASPDKQTGATPIVVTTDKDPSAGVSSVKKEDENFDDAEEPEDEEEEEEEIKDMPMIVSVTKGDDPEAAPRVSDEEDNGIEAAATTTTIPVGNTLSSTVPGDAAAPPPRGDNTTTVNVTTTTTTTENN